LERLTDSSHKASYLIFGKGGGFSGKGFEYRLSNNGILEKNSNEAFIPYGKIPKNITQQIFHNYFMLKLDSMRMNAPGNMYYFIQLDALGKGSNRITWGKEPLTYPDIAAYFSMLTDVVKKFGDHAVQQ
jgi:hypothetical protein